MLHKTHRVRDEQVPAQNQYDLQYADITTDWTQSMQGVYDFLGMPFTVQAREAMQAWRDGNQQHKHGTHKYSLADFGLQRDEVDRRLMFYRERFNIPYETTNPHMAAAKHTTGDLP